MKNIQLLQYPLLYISQPTWIHFQDGGQPERIPRSPWYLHLTGVFRSEPFSVAFSDFSRRLPILNEK